MGIDDEDPEVRTLRSELLKTLRDAAFETYVNFGDRPSQRRNMEGHIFASAIVAAITPEIFRKAGSSAFRAGGGFQAWGEPDCPTAKH